MSVRVIVPAQEQITLPEARLHLRMDDDGDSPAAHPDDAWLSGVGIPAAREYCEGWLGRALAPQTLELVQDSFSPAMVQHECVGRFSSWCLRRSSESCGGSSGLDEVWLPMPPIASVDSLRYYDADGTLQTMSSSGYYVDDYGGRIVLVSGTSWPTTQTRPNAVRVRYQAGYNLPDDSPLTNPLPYALKAAMLLVLGSLYEQREDSAEKAQQPIPLGAQSLMMPYRLRLGMA
jgi:hypothetical protein